MTTVLVTGATGFVGKKVMQYASTAKGIKKIRVLIRSRQFATFALPDSEIEVCEGDITQKETLRSIAKGVDVVVHLASKNIDTDDAVLHNVNVVGMRNLCEVAEENGIRRFIYLSSAGVYGHAAHVEADESADMRPDTVLARSKATAEKMLWSWHQQRRGHATILRPRFVYGEGDVHVVPRFIYAAKKVPVCLDGGKARLSFVFVDDLALSVWRFVCTPAGSERPEVFNVTDGYPISYREVLRLISEVFGVGRKRYSVPFAALYFPTLLYEKITRTSPEASRHPFSTTRLKLVGRENSFSNAALRRRFSDFEFRSLREGLAQSKEFYAHQAKHLLSHI
jgi:nucleoside-diphosphate-sugar epimerase